MFLTVFTPPFKIDDFYPWRSKTPLCVGTVLLLPRCFYHFCCCWCPWAYWRPCCCCHSCSYWWPMPCYCWLSCRALQMKGQWESNINVWFPLMYSQKLNCYFQNRINMFCLPVPTLIYLWEIYIFPGSVCLFCCSEICGPILGIYQWLTDIWIWKLGLRPRNSQKRNT